MKKVFVLFIVGVLLFWACSAQNTNIGQRIIGTWDDHLGYTWVFNNNGTLTLANSEYKFAVADTKLAFVSSSNANKKYALITPSNRDSLYIYNISMSSDGKTLFLTTMKEGDETGYWLTKKIKGKIME